MARPIYPNPGNPKDYALIMNRGTMSINEARRLEGLPRSGWLPSMRFDRFETAILRTIARLVNWFIA